MYFWWWRDYFEKCELNQVIKDNTNDTNDKLRMIPTVTHKCFGFPLYEITVK